jgi:hypothetical protein
LIPDFSLPVVYGDTVIISRKRVPQVSGKFWMSMFDLASTVGLAASIFMAWLLCLIKVLKWFYYRNFNVRGWSQNQSCQMA